MAWHHRVIGKFARAVWWITKPRTIGVRAVLLDQDNRIALVRHTYTDQWYLPGGGVKKGESTRSAIERELGEEIAVENPTIERVLGVYHSRRESKDDHIVIFVARTEWAGDKRMRRADLTEIAEAEWFDLDGLPVSTSPATTRRIAEYRAGASGMGDWSSAIPPFPINQRFWQSGHSASAQSRSFNLSEDDTETGRSPPQKRLIKKAKSQR